MKENLNAVLLNGLNAVFGRVLIELTAMNDLRYKTNKLYTL